MKYEIWIRGLITNNEISERQPIKHGPYFTSTTGLEKLTSAKPPTSATIKTPIIKPESVFNISSTTTQSVLIFEENLK